MTVSSRIYYPDIAVYYNEGLAAVCSIKVYLTQGWNTVKSEVAKLEDMRSCYPEMRALLVIFSVLSKRGTIYPQLKRVADDNGWFSFIVLQENAQPLRKVIRDCLGLDRVAPGTASEHAYLSRVRD